MALIIAVKIGLFFYKIENYLNFHKKELLEIFIQEQEEKERILWEAKLLADEEAAAKAKLQSIDLELKKQQLLEESKKPKGFFRKLLDTIFPPKKKLPLMESPTSPLIEDSKAIKSDTVVENPQLLDDKAMDNPVIITQDFNGEGIPSKETDGPLENRDHQRTKEINEIMGINGNDEE
jgi:hypothetical protein